MDVWKLLDASGRNKHVETKNWSGSEQDGFKAFEQMKSKYKVAAKTPEQEASDKKIVDKLESEEASLEKEISKLKDKLRNMELRYKHIGTEIKKRSMSSWTKDRPGEIITEYCVYGTTTWEGGVGRKKSLQKSC